MLTQQYKIGDFVRFKANVFFLMCVRNVFRMHHGHSGDQAYEYVVDWMDASGQYQTGRFVQDALLPG